MGPRTPFCRKVSPNCPLCQRPSVSDGGSLTSPVDTIKGEVRFAWLGCRGDSTSHPLSFLEQSLASPIPCPQSNCGARGVNPSTHAFSLQALRMDLLAGTCWMLGWI